MSYDTMYLYCDECKAPAPDLATYMKHECKPVAKNYFDREPTNCITAEQVREYRAVRERTKDANADVDAMVWCHALQGLLIHPGVSSSARAVIEAALE